MSRLLDRSMSQMYYILIEDNGSSTVYSIEKLYNHVSIGYDHRYMVTRLTLSLRKSGKQS